MEEYTFTLPEIDAMLEKAEEEYNVSIHNLIAYFKDLHEKAGLHWDEHSEKDIEKIIDAIVNKCIATTKRDMEYRMVEHESLKEE